MALKKAVFLDKDGTLVVDVPCNVDPKKIVLVSNAVAALRLLSELGYKLLVITNQSGIARGYFSEQELILYLHELDTLFRESNIILDGFYYCPHDKSADCDCRKPKPGMVQKAARELGIDLAASWFIGNTLNDAEAGYRAGCRTILIDGGNETLEEFNRDSSSLLQSAERLPHYIVPDLYSASHIINSKSNSL
ncbi:HAD family hydrolase [Microcoleus sp. Pol12A5]|uniref:HAD family hydrolase n=1 Tax=Microcoleus sp. Pol12A5 TaxID=3055392 RepID=UPI002FCF952C